MTQKTIENNWVQLDSDVYTLYLKSFEIEGSMKTVVIDNFSITPLTIQNYDLANTVIEEDWGNVYDAPFVEYDEYAFDKLAQYLSEKDFQDVKEIAAIHFGK